MSAKLATATRDPSSVSVVPSDGYRTPWPWVARVREVFDYAIDIDPCASPEFDIATTNWQLERDGNSLARPWDGFKNAFTNPPYSQPNLPLWAEKILHETSHGLELIALVPCDPSTESWRSLWLACTAQAFTKRIKFIGADQCAKFASSFFYFGPRARRFHDVFESAKCLVVRP